MIDKMKKAVMICAAVTAIPVYAQTDSAEVAEPRIGWQIDAVSEGQWSMSNGRGNWANILSARLMRTLGAVEHLRWQHLLRDSSRMGLWTTFRTSLTSMPKAGRSA